MHDDYVRAVTPLDVIDGDTFRCDVDLGFHVTVRMLCRLAGINAPDRGEGGYLEARAELARVLAYGPVDVHSIRADKYAGRFDAHVVVVIPPGVAAVDGPVDVASWLIGAEVAVRWDGRGARPLVPWPPTRTETR